MQNINIPLVFEDWDVEIRTKKECLEKVKEVEREMILTMIINFFFNLLMLVPLIFTGNIFAPF